ncbi:DUF885 domain-containing protein [Steroidobacter sp. S1-65]|uniref:DUF885 domain-containing protein n=1 Tax=Steroidobacter gossypii TaxID=2805490 RepID=A0ABS1WSA5_9GAMM|nr:DUF885 domain-containing protein [Steroidobacter gossypii]MBM0103861.1 DUF885 domain-containing protein [Steroidobacter gossypii]
MQRSKLLATLTYALLLPGLACAQESSTRAAPTRSAQAQPSRSTVDAFFARFSDEWVRGNPDLATSSRYFSGEEQSRLEQQLTPRTRAYSLERIKLAKRGLADLQKYDRSKMSEAQRVSAELMQWQLETIVAGEAYLDYDFPLDQFSGANVGLVESLTLRHPLVKPEDASNYVARMKQIGTRMDEAVAEARRLAAKKMVPPRFIVETTLKSMRTFSDAAPAQNPLVTAFAQRIQNIEGLSTAQRTELQGQATRIVTEQVYPAWRRAIALLEGILPNTTNDAGLWRFEGGDKAYAYALGRFTTTKLTADEIHEIGLQQVARIEGEMDKIFRKLGRTQGTVAERVKQLRADLSYPDPTSDASRSAIMRDIDAMMADALKRSPSLFDLQPKSPVVAQPFPRFREASAAANYNRAPLDGSRSAIFQMPLRPQRMTKFGLRTLVYHETVPGHHFQIALEQENTELPKFRQARVLGGISAMSEGWALYAENLVAENGWYEGDPEGLLGMLDAQLFRARRLVVDTGLHAKKWTRQQAIDYGLEASEVERYVVYPGQACSYMIGQLEILKLRDRAREALGDKFSPQQFHNVVLRTGTAPLELLGREVDRYVASASAN